MLPESVKNWDSVVVIVIVVTRRSLRFPISLTHAGRASSAGMSALIAEDLLLPHLDPAQVLGLVPRGELKAPVHSQCQSSLGSSGGHIFRNGVRVWLLYPVPVPVACGCYIPCQCLDSSVRIPAR